ncbi:MAG TPA: RluA family pseudouridine synthase [Alphaproteobacteria bacterium]|nr:RluA family pseudouridine synthase [Alphaproteobacteria bacterium]
MGREVKQEEAGPTGAAAEHRVEIGAAEAGARLDAALARALPALSRSRLKRLIESGSVIHVPKGAAATDASAKVKPGDRFLVRVPAAEPARPAAQAIPLDIIYEDANLIVVDKTAGLVVHPAAGNPDRTLVNALLAHCGGTLSGIGGVRRPGIVHRLDKDTSGLLVAAKTDRAHASLAAQFAAHTVERAYVALVWGAPKPREGTIAGQIGRSARDRKKMAVVARGGKRAVTRYRVRASYKGVASLVECRLETGRTHQIRVHLASIGHPLMGDPVYGRLTAERRAALPPAAQAALAALGRQALDAYLLGFRHPASGEALRFEKKFAIDFMRLNDCLEKI